MLTTRLARLPTLAVFARRAYSEYPGTVAQSKGFSKKEKAHEDQYAREKERKELEALRKQLDMIQEKVDNLANNVKKDTEKEKK